MIDSGRLDKRVRFERRSELRTGSGEEQNVWAPIATVWADVKQLEGREAYSARQIAAEATHLVRIRHLPGLHVKDRAVWGMRILDIEHISTGNDRRFEMNLLCTERA